MGGEKLRLLTLLLILPGSPPHGRGKATAEYQAAMDTGITPAWAGKSLGFMLWQIWRLGSPPHGRGKVCTCCCASPLARITPAWAGKRVKPQWAACAAQDHPRMGGEKLGSLDPLSATQGSPPHGRGKDIHCQEHTRPPGITPAWAGKSPDPPTPPTPGGDHPRMGGEKALMPENRLIMEGSPPHGRGKALNVQKVEKQGRITPAWAGKRSPLTASKPTFWDHPRMGGEKYDCTGQEFTNWGSPPRRRGKEQPHH